MYIYTPYIYTSMYTWCNMMYTSIPCRSSPCKRPLRLRYDKLTC